MPKDPYSFPFFCIGNKNDLVEERSVSQELVDGYLEKNPDVLYHETSAMEGTNIEKMF